MGDIALIGSWSFGRTPECDRIPPGQALISLNEATEGSGYGPRPKRFETTHPRSAWQAAEALKLTRHLLNVAMDEELIARDVAARLPLPETSRQSITVLMPEQLARAAEELPERFRALALLGGYAGLRWSELVAVRRNDIDLDVRKVRVDERLTEIGGGGAWAWGKPKTSGSTRTVDLPALVVRPLATHLLRFPPLHSTDDPRLEGLVFYLESGSPVRRHVFRKQWRRACDRAQVPPIRLEWLRHMGASLAYAASHEPQGRRQSSRSHEHTDGRHDVPRGVRGRWSRPRGRDRRAG